MANIALTNQIKELVEEKSHLKYRLSKYEVNLFKLYRINNATVLLKEMKRPKDSVEMPMKSKDSTNALSNHVPNLMALKDLSTNITNSSIQKYMPLFLMCNQSLAKKAHKKKVTKNNSQTILEIQIQNLTVFSKNLVI